MRAGAPLVCGGWLVLGRGLVGLHTLVRRSLPAAPQSLATQGPGLTGPPGARLYWTGGLLVQAML